jgi:O-antigen ligase
MQALLAPFRYLQILYIPALLGVLIWSVWHSLSKRDFAVGLGLYFALLIVVDGFYNTGIYLPGVSQGSIKYSELYAALLIMRLPSAGTPPMFLRVVSALVGLYFLLLFASALRITPVIQGVMDFRKIIVPQIITFFMVRRGFGSYVDYRRFLLCFTAVVMIISLFMIWDMFFDHWLMHSDMLNKVEYYYNRNHKRFGSILLNPNLLGAFVVAILPLYMGAILVESNRWLRTYFGAIVLLLLFCLVETQSRAPLIALGISVVLFVVGPVAGISRFRRFLAVGIATLILFSLMPGFLDHAMQRFSTIDAENSQDTLSRATVWQYTRHLISERPVLGIGFGERNFLDVMSGTDFAKRFGQQSLDNPHNSYLQMTVYAGVPCLVVFLVLNAALLGRAFYTLWTDARERQRTATLFGLAVGMLGLLISTYAEPHLFTGNLGSTYWMLAGLLLSVVSHPDALVVLSRNPPTTARETWNDRRLKQRTRRSTEYTGGAN